MLEGQIEAQRCPVCDVETEPERDGDYHYFECENEDCEAGGYTWGFIKIQVAQPDGSCSLGVPEDVRRSASAPMEQALRPKAGVVDLGLTIKVRS